MVYIWSHSKTFTFRVPQSKGLSMFVFSLFFKQLTLELTIYKVQYYVKGSVSSKVLLEFVGINKFCALAVLTLDCRSISCPTVTFMVCFWRRRLSFSWSWITRSDDTSVKRRTRKPDNWSIHLLRNRKHFHISTEIIETIVEVCKSKKTLGFKEECVWQEWK